MTKTVAIYARYSSELQNPTSIDDQIAMARRFCEQQGWTVTHVYSDYQMSGRSRNRPEFKKMIDAAVEREFDMIVVEAVDRLTRRLTHALQSFELISFRGVGLHSVTEGPQDFFRVMLNALGAQLFSESTANHTRRTKEGMLERKGRLHSRAYGYRRRECKNGRNREIDPGEAAIVLRIFEEAAEGKSAEQIAIDLNREGIPSPTGGLWHSSTLRGNKKRGEGILRNRLYIGIGRFGGTRRSFHPETGVRNVKPTPDEMIEAEMPELRIVPQELWDAAQAKIEESALKVSDSGNPRAAHRTRYLLSGLLTCAHCGRAYVICGKERYGCRGHRHGVCDNARMIKRQRIEARVFARLRRSLLIPDLSPPASMRPCRRSARSWRGRPARTTSAGSAGKGRRRSAPGTTSSRPSSGARPSRPSRHARGRSRPRSRSSPGSWPSSSRCKRRTKASRKAQKRLMPMRCVASRTFSARPTSSTAPTGTWRN